MLGEGGGGGCKAYIMYTITMARQGEVCVCVCVLGEGGGGGCKAYIMYTIIYGSSG